MKRLRKTVEKKVWIYLYDKRVYNEKILYIYIYIFVRNIIIVKTKIF